MTTAPALASRQRMNPRKSRSWTYEGMWCIVWTRIVLQPDKRLSETELWSTHKIVRSRISFKLAWTRRTWISFKLARTTRTRILINRTRSWRRASSIVERSHKAFKLGRPYFEEELVQSHSWDGDQSGNWFQLKFSRRRWRRGRPLMDTKPWKRRRIEISKKYITTSNLKGIEADSKVL